MKKIVLLVMFLFVVQIPMFAELYTCVVHQVGPTASGQVNIALSDINGAFGWTWFELPADDDVSDKMLAVALTAFATGSYLRVDLPANPVENDDVQKMYIRE